MSDGSLILLIIEKNIDSSEPLCNKLYDDSVIEKAKEIIIKYPQISIPEVYNQVSEIQQNAEKKYNNLFFNSFLYFGFFSITISSIHIKRHHKW